MQNSRVTQTATVKTEGSLLLSKLSNLFVGLIVFFASTQLGFHFWSASSLVYGIRIDYLSPTIYFLDTLIVLFLAVKGSDLKGRAQPADAKAGRSDPIGTIVPILLVNLLYSQNPLATLSWSLHFLLYCLFFTALLPQFRSLRDSRRAIGTLRPILMVALSLSLLFQTILASVQVFLGHSVGGLVYYLGERTVAVGAPGIALGTFMDHVVLRAYGTFSHPNILAGWSVVSLLILIQLSQTANPNASKQQVVRGSDPLRKSWPTAKMFSRLQNTIRRPGQTLWVPLISVLLIIFLTQSRAAALALFGLIIPLYLLKNLKLRFLYYFITLLLYYSLATSLLSPPRSDLSLSQRATLQGVSLSTIREFPIFGTGTQASISTYPSVVPNFRLLQPDHNSLTLFLSWFGLFGVLAVIVLALGSDLLKKSWLSAKMFSRTSKASSETRSDPAWIIIPLLPLLFFDHYLLTSPQGSFILLLYLFCTLNYPYAQKNL
ncbi:MAG: O-antigen ligase family protein [Microgenomates group bacterium]